MSTTQNNSINQRVFTEKNIDILLHKVIGSRRIELIVLYQRYPHGARYSCHRNIRIKLAHFKRIRQRVDSTRSGQQPYVPTYGKRVDTFYRRTYHAQHTASRSQMRQVVLLNGAQRLCRSGVTSQDNERTSQLEKLAYGLKRKIINHFERTGAIRRTGIIAQINIVVLRQQLAYLSQYGQSSVSGIEYANRSCR